MKIYCVTFARVVNIGAPNTMDSCSFPITQVKEGEWTSPRTILLEGVPIHDFFAMTKGASIFILHGIQRMWLCHFMNL